MNGPMKHPNPLKRLMIPVALLNFSMLQISLRYGVVRQIRPAYYFKKKNQL